MSSKFRVQFGVPQGSILGTLLVIILKFDTTDKKQENKGEPVFISWTAPSDPNLLIVNYKIKIQNDAGSQELESCFTAKQYQANDNR